MAKQRLVVIGNGMAGARFVEELLRRDGGARFEITVFGAEARGNYNRILLSNVLNGQQSADEIILNPLEWYQQNDITLRHGVRVISIDRNAQQVLAEDNSRTPYDVLVLATGSRPYLPPIEGLSDENGARKAGVFVMRTIDDCDRIAQFAQGVEKAAVIGGGLLGLEAARGLMRFGAQVSVVHRGAHLMNQQLDAASGAMLGRAIEKLGLQVRLSKNTTRVLGTQHVAGLEFSDGETLDCAMVVVACGIAPRVELAQACGLSVNRAVAVDDQMRSIDDAAIYVVGECAEHRGQTYGLVAPLWEQARVLADVLSGRNENVIYQGSKTSTKLKVLGIDLASMGEIEARDDDEEIVYSEPKRGRYKKLIIRDGHLVGAILLGDLNQAAGLGQTFERDIVLPHERAELLFEIGEGAKTSVANLPDDATICHCNAVSKGALELCIENGAASLPEIMAQTRAGTGCGSCKDVLRELLAAPPQKSNGVLQAV